MIKWMTRRGAKNVVIVSRSSTVSPQVAAVMEDAKSIGSNVVLHQCDVANAQDVQRMVSQIKETLPPVRGVVHSAMVLHVSRPTTFTPANVQSLPTSALLHMILESSQIIHRMYCSRT